MDFIEQDLNSMLSIGGQNPAMRGRVASSHSAKGIKPVIGGGNSTRAGTHFPSPPIVGGGGPSSARSSKQQQQPSASIDLERSEWEAFNNRSRQVLTGLAHRSHGTNPNGGNHQPTMAGGAKSTPNNGPSTSSDAYIRQFLEQNGGGRTTERHIIHSSTSVPSGTARRGTSATHGRALAPLQPSSQLLQPTFPSEVYGGNNSALLLRGDGNECQLEQPPPRRSDRTTEDRDGRRLGTGATAVSSAMAWEGSQLATTSSSTFGRLTVDLLIFICGFCDPATLVRLGGCNRRLQRAHLTPAIWKHLFYSYGVCPPTTTARQANPGQVNDPFYVAPIFDIDDIRPVELRKAVINHVVTTRRELLEDLSSAADRLRSVEQRLQFRHNESQRLTYVESSSALSRAVLSSNQPVGAGAFSRNVPNARDRLSDEMIHSNGSAGYTNGLLSHASPQPDSQASRQLAADIIVLRRQVADLSNQLAQLNGAQRLQQQREHSVELAHLLSNPSKGLVVLQQFERSVITSVVLHARAISSLPIAITRGTESFQQLELALLSLGAAHVSPQAVATAQSRWASVQRSFPLAPYYDMKDELNGTSTRPHRPNAEGPTISLDSRRLLALVSRLVSMPPQELVEYFKIV